MWLEHKSKKDRFQLSLTKMQDTIISDVKLCAELDSGSQAKSVLN